MPSTAAATPAATTGAPPRETLRERRQREAREAREREAREREARASSQPAAPVGNGTVRLAISPWGLVEIDGQPAGAAPPLTELTLAEGRHQVVVRNGDFAAFTMTVDVVAGQVMVLRHRFGS